MIIHQEVRASDSPLVARITRVRYDGRYAGDPDVTTPDGCWDIVIRRVQGRVAVLQTGLITKPVTLDYRPGDEYLSVSFKPGVFMPRSPGSRMIDRGRLRPMPSAVSFWLHQERLEIPTFENAEGMVQRLVRRGLIARDELVTAVAAGERRAASPRSVQRHFQHALGMTAKRLEQVQRACRAVELLRAGRRPVDVALELGYADQPHLTRSLRGLMGRTPGEIAGR